MKYSYFFFVVFFTAIALVSCDKNKTAALPVASSVPSTSGGKIVFVNIDSLLSQYQLTKDQKDSLEKEAIKAEKAFGAKVESFQKRSAKFQKDIYDIQQKAQNIPPVELKAMEEKFKAQGEALAKEEEALGMQRNAANEQLNKGLANVDKQLITKINTYLEKIAAEKGYDFILMKGAGGGVLFGNKNLDVTQPIVEALNAEYKNVKK
jgi:outer membrane protein